MIVLTGCCCRPVINFNLNHSEMKKITKVIVKPLTQLGKEAHKTTAALKVISCISEQMWRVRQGGAVESTSPFPECLWFLWFGFLIFNFEKVFTYLFGCTGSQLWHSGPLLVGSNSLTQDQTWGPCIEVLAIGLTSEVRCWVN